MICRAAMKLMLGNRMKCETVTVEDVLISSLTLYVGERSQCGAAGSGAAASKWAARRTASARAAPCRR